MAFLIYQKPWMKSPKVKNWRFIIIPSCLGTPFWQADKINFCKRARLAWLEFHLQIAPIVLMLTGELYPLRDEARTAATTPCRTKAFRFLLSFIGAQHKFDCAKQFNKVGIDAIRFELFAVTNFPSFVKIPESLLHFSEPNKVRRTCVDE